MFLVFREYILYSVSQFSHNFYSGSFPQQQSPIYFNRTDVKKVIHAPLDVDWAECSEISVFPHGDASLPPALTVLPSVIEKNNRTVIVHGLADFILIAEGFVHSFFRTDLDLTFNVSGQES